MAGRGNTPAALTALAAERAKESAPPRPVQRPNPPAGLGKAGKAFWDRMHGSLADDLRFSVKELELLQRACSLADREAALSRLVAKDGLTVAGSQGQTVLHPAVTELRHVEAALCGLVKQVSTEDTSGVPVSPTQQRAKNAAEVRWGMQRAKDERQAQRVRGG